MKVLVCLAGLLVCSACSDLKNSATSVAKVAEPAYYRQNPATAGMVEGAIHFKGRVRAPKRIDITSDPACVGAHHGAPVDESLVVEKGGGLANVFVYIKSGLEGKQFEHPSDAAVMDQRGCWFEPHVLGIQTGQTLKVTNSDPVTHNIHPLAEVNREWNKSMGQGDAPLARRFTKREVMVRVKCNIHSWMRGYIGVVEHPYFAVSDKSGAFALRNVPPGDYVLEAWHETLGVQQMKVSVKPSGKIEADFTFKGD